MNEQLRPRSTCLFFIATGSKALVLPNTRKSCASSKSRFRRLFAILNQERLMALKCNCVTVRRDFDNESAGRREVLFPSFPDPVDAQASELHIVSGAGASACLARLHVWRSWQRKYSHFWLREQSRHSVAAVNMSTLTALHKQRHL